MTATPKDSDIQQLTLTEFLLARIAEDEDRARDDWGRDGWVPIGLWDADRIVRECGTKRRVVEMRDWPGPPSANGYIDAILGALASVYADHPDYREEWKP